MNQLIEGVDWRSVQVVRQVVHACLQILISLIEEVLSRSALTVIARRDKQGIVIFEVAQSFEYLDEPLQTAFFFLLLPRLWKLALRVAHERSSWAPTVVSIDTDPDSFELGLNHF